MKSFFYLLVLFFSIFSFTQTQAQSTNDSIESEELVFTFVEQQPEFPGGQEGMMKFLAENIRYPATALKESIEGLVVAQFTIDKTGKIKDVKVIKELGGGTDEEAIRVISAMPDWKPGKQNGKEVNVKYTLPIRFQFATKKKKKL